MAMRWNVGLTNGSAAAGLAFVRQRLATFDTSKLEALRIEPGNRRYVGVYGRCFYPTLRRPVYRVDCFVPGPFPGKIRIRKPPIYPRPDGTFPKAPPGCRRTVACVDVRSGRTWYRVIGWTFLRNLDEAVVWIAAHELFHFLRHSRQIKGRNNEIEADTFADGWLESFHAGRTPPAPPPLVARFAKTLFERIG